MWDGVQHRRSHPGPEPRRPPAQHRAHHRRRRHGVGHRLRHDRANVLVGSDAAGRSASASTGQRARPGAAAGPGRLHRRHAPRRRPQRPRRLCSAASTPSSGNQYEITYTVDRPKDRSIDLELTAATVGQGLERRHRHRHAGRRPLAPTSVDVEGARACSRAPRQVAGRAARPRRRPASLAYALDPPRWCATRRRLDAALQPYAADGTPSTRRRRTERRAHGPDRARAARGRAHRPFAESRGFLQWVEARSSGPTCRCAPRPRRSSSTRCSSVVVLDAARPVLDACAVRRPRARCLSPAVPAIVLSCLASRRQAPVHEPAARHAAAALGHAPGRLLAAAGRRGRVPGGRRPDGPGAAPGRHRGPPRSSARGGARRRRPSAWPAPTSTGPSWPSASSARSAATWPSSCMTVAETMIAARAPAPRRACAHRRRPHQRHRPAASCPSASASDVRRSTPTTSRRSSSDRIGNIMLGGVGAPGPHRASTG